MKVVVTDMAFDAYEEEKTILEENGIELIITDNQSEDAIIEAAKDADGLLNANVQITEKIIESLPNLKVISRYGIGYDTIDVKAATSNKIYVTNVPDYCVDEVSDHALTLILTSCRKIVPMNDQLKKRNRLNAFDLAPIRRFNSQTVGLVSFGNIAKKLCKKLQSIGFNVIAYDPFCGIKEEKDYGIQLVPLEELLRNSDIISIHSPLVKDTYHLIGEEALKLVKKNLFIVNTSRGPVINEKALIKALQEKRIAGAALDVFEIEPIDPNNPLLNLDNVILTPHAAYYSDESCSELKSKAAKNIVNVLKGGVPEYWVNHF
ncbi:C-terminal binding protein [Gottfriedia sp. NPDC057991]|uniref:C-terminal binding protein n=1 Tax=Gottfriedia sp. NPDC057991 TaxID=3346298 RepID=UPI0036D9BD9A